MLHTAPVWTDGLDAWYARHGRHQLPWRHTRDPWAVLVSEVMLQQTSVSRVLRRWTAFLARWPAPADFAATPLDEVLRSWDGLGYPRRARNLHRAAAAVGARGWPADEAGLRALPGIGAYTARALLAFTRDDAAAPPPRDVNLGRVAARAALGVELHQAAPAVLDAVLLRSRPASTPPRDHVFALFDLGATVCGARRPRCAACPLQTCASRARLSAALPPPPPRRQAPYRGSVRELRGAVLRAMLTTPPPAGVDDLRARVGHLGAAADPHAVTAVMGALREEGLLSAEWSA